MLATGAALAAGAAPAPPAEPPPKPPGSLDTSFGGDGTVVHAFVPGAAPATSTPFEAQAMALQPDGKIVVAGSGSLGRTAVMRFTATGAVDIAFGSRGQVHDEMGGPVGNALSVAVQADGRILVAGFVNWDGGVNANFALARYDTDGSPDVEFGSKGYVTTDFAADQDIAFAMALQPDGRIVVAGQALSWGKSQDFALARYLPDGTLDTGFGAGGKTVTNLHSGADSARAIALLPDGRILVAGTSWQKSSGYDFAVLRYRADGRLDTGFGTGGSVTIDFEGLEDIAHAIAVQPDGRIVVAGHTLTISNISGEREDFALVRLDADGSLDSTFGRGGRLTTDFEGRLDLAHALVLQPDGQIVVAGQSVRKRAPTKIDFALARYSVDGRLDHRFGDGGKVMTDIEGLAGLDAISALVLQPDGRLLAVGRTVSTEGTHHFALARYLP